MTQSNDFQDTQAPFGSEVFSYKADKLMSLLTIVLFLGITYGFYYLANDIECGLRFRFYGIPITIEPTEAYWLIMAVFGLMVYLVVLMFLAFINSFIYDNTLTLSDTFLILDQRFFWKTPQKTQVFFKDVRDIQETGQKSSTFLRIFHGSGKLLIHKAYLNKKDYETVRSKLIEVFGL